MSSHSESKNLSAVKHRSKIPMSAQKSETKSNLASLPNEHSSRLTNTKSRSMPNTNLPVSKLRVTNAANSLKRMFEKKCNLLNKHSCEIKEAFLIKQKEVERIYSEAMELREKMLAAGTEDVEEINDVLFTLIPTRNNKKRVNVDKIIDLEKAEKFISSLRPKLEKMPSTLLEMCRATLVKRSELTQQLSEILTDPKDQELLSKLDSLQSNDEESLALENMQANYKILISSVFTELNNFLTDIKNYQALMLENLSDDVSEKLNATLTELNTERARNSGLIERKHALERQMNEMKVKIKKLEEQVAEKDTRLAHQRQKEVNLDHGIKDLKTLMEKNKEALELRIKELKKENDLREKEFNDYKKETEGRVKEFIKEIEEETAKRKAAEASLNALQQQYQMLEEKSMNLCEMTCDLKSIKGKDADLTENEIVLYEKLKCAQENIEKMEKQLQELQDAKNQLSMIFQKGSENENVDVESQLMIEIGNNNLLNNKYEKLKQNFDKMCEENHSLEKQLLEMKSRLLMTADDVERNKLALEIAQLEQQTNDLKSSLVEVRDRNTQLEKSLTKTQLSLESKDRELKKVQQILQQRFEVFQVLKPDVFNNTDAHLQKRNHDDHNKLINEYIETLSEKQKKIECMKKTINRLMDQENRAQKSRTNLEQRIAMLEKENSELKMQKPRSRILGIW